MPEQSRHNHHVVAIPCPVKEAQQLQTVEADGADHVAFRPALRISPFGRHLERDFKRVVIRHHRVGSGPAQRNHRAQAGPALEFRRHHDAQSMLTRELERLREEDRRREARLTALVTGLTRQLQAQQTNCAALEASVDELAEDLDRFRTSLQEFEQRSSALAKSLKRH